MKKKFFEVFLTNDNVSEESWLEFILYISKLNGRFKRWEIYIFIEKGTIRYFIKTRKNIPTTLSFLNDFLIKEIEKIEYPKTNLLKFFYIITNKERSIVDIYDKLESRKNKKIVYAKLKIFPLICKRFFCFTSIILEGKKKKTAKNLLFNIPQSFLSINFSKHTRFLYKKEMKKYLNIEKTLKIFDSDNKSGILKINAFPYISDEYYLNLSNYDFDKHSIIIGSSGAGKSKLISSFIYNLYKNDKYKMKYKVILIDPHSSLEEDIGGLDKTRIIDFKSLNNSMDLFKTSKENYISESEILLSTFKFLMGSQFNSKLERVLRHSILLLLQIEKFSLKIFEKLLTSSEFRNDILKKYRKIITEPVYDFFINDFVELKNKSHEEAISPILSFIEELSIFPVFNYNEELDNLENIVNENFLSIFSLNENILGEKIVKTLSGLILGQIFSFIMQKKIDEHLILILDEVSIIQNPIIKRFLSESRKYNVSIILSGQYFNQIDEDIQKSIFANVINYYTFRVSREDAVILSKNMQMEMAVHDSYFNKVKLLTTLSNRECVVRVGSNGKVLQAFKATTLDFISIPRKKENLESKKVEKINNKKITKKFNINESINIYELMKSQSTGRRKIKNEG